MARLIKVEGTAALIVIRLHVYIFFINMFARANENENMQTVLPGWKNCVF